MPSLLTFLQSKRVAKECLKNSPVLSTESLLDFGVTYRRLDRRSRRSILKRPLAYRGPSVQIIYCANSPALAVTEFWVHRNHISREHDRNQVSDSRRSYRCRAALEW